MRNKRLFLVGDIISLDNYWNIRIIGTQVGRDGKILNYIAQADYFNFDTKDFSENVFKEEIARMTYMLPPNVMIVHIQKHEVPTKTYNK